MALHVGELLLGLAIEYAIGAAVAAIGRASRDRPTTPRGVVAPHMPVVASRPGPSPDHEALSSVPGRIRLPVAGLRGDRARAAAVQAELADCPGIMRATASHLTGNLLVHYDPAQTSVARIRATLAGELPLPVTRAA